MSGRLLAREGWKSAHFGAVGKAQGLDQVEGPLTLGLVPLAYRYERLKMSVSGADFAAWLGVKDMVTHVGFIPENPNDPDTAAWSAACVTWCSTAARAG